MSRGYLTLPRLVALLCGVVFICLLYPLPLTQVVLPEESCVPHAANFSFLSFASQESASWETILQSYEAYHREVIRQPTLDSRYLVSAPSWNQVGVANNLEAMTLSLFFAIATDRVLLFPYSRYFESIFMAEGILAHSLGHDALRPMALRGRYQTLSYKDIDYVDLYHHLRSWSLACNFMADIDVVFDMPPDACGFPYAGLYEHPRYSALLAKLGDWRRPLSKFLLRFQPSVLKKVDTWLATLPSGPLVALQLRFQGILTPVDTVSSFAGACLCGLLFDPKRQLRNATVVIVTDEKSSKQRKNVARQVLLGCNSAFPTLRPRIEVSPAIPLHVIYDQNGEVAFHWAAYDLAILSRAELGLVTPASSFGYVGLYLGRGDAFLLNPYDIADQCNVNHASFLSNALSRNVRRPAWVNPSYDGIASCSMHDSSFVRAQPKLLSGSCNAELCPLCSCISPEAAAAKEKEKRFITNVHT